MELQVLSAVSICIIIILMKSGTVATMLIRSLNIGLLLLLIPSALFGQKEQAQSKYNVRVDLVSLDVEVLDQKGNLVQGLTQPDFVVEENGKRVEITHFALSQGRPISLAVVLDTSALSTGQLSVCKAFLQTIIHRFEHSDEFCLFSFDARDAYLEQDFTADRPRLIKALDNIGVTSRNSGGLLRELFSSAPVSGLAIDLALQKLGTAQNPKKALIVISNRFRGVGPATVEHIHRSGCTLLTLAFPHKSSLAVAFGDAISTNQLMRESGGRQFSAEAKSIDRLCSQVASSLKNYYSIGFAVQITSGDTKPRKISVHIPGHKYKIYFRRTYTPQ